VSSAVAAVGAGPSYTQIIDLLGAAAAACDARLERMRPVNPEQISLNSSVRSVVPRVGGCTPFCFYLERVAFTTYEIDGEVSYGMRFDSPIFGGQLRDLITCWARSRGWVGESGVYKELGPYLDYRELLTVIEESVRRTLKAEGFSDAVVGERVSRRAGGGRLAPANYGFDMTVELLVDLCDLTFPYRSARWLKIFDLFAAAGGGRAVGREVTYAIADCFEGAADKLGDEYWKMLLELVGANGCKARFSDAVVLLAGAVAL